jgi:hypothetical protein
MTLYQHHARQHSTMLKPHSQLCMNCWRARQATVDGMSPGHARRGNLGQPRNLPRPSPSQGLQCARIRPPRDRPMTDLRMLAEFPAADPKVRHGIRNPGLLVIILQ